MINNPAEYYEEFSHESEIKKVAIYARKSRSYEGEKDLANHLTRLKARCQLNEWDYTVYKEVVSGGNLEDRTKMLQLLEDIKAGLYDAVVVTDIDRLSRGKGADLDKILGVLKHNNCKIVQETQYEVYDLNNPNHAQMLEMKLFFGNMELSQIKKRYKEGKRLARFMGKWVDGVAPYGYKIDNKTKFLIPDEEEAIVLIKMKDYFLEHNNATHVAWLLNREGYRTRSGADWSSSKVSRYLKNEVYTGTYIYNKGTGSYKNNHKEQSYSSGTPYTKNTRDKWKRKENNHPALISKREHDEIMKYFNGKGIGKGYHRKTYALSGLCVDEKGRKLSILCYGNPRKPQSVSLTERERKDTDPIEFHSVRIELIEQAIKVSIDMLKEKIVKILKENNNEKEILAIQKEIDVLKSEIETIENAIEKIQEGFIYGVYDALEAKNLKIKQEKKIEKLEEELTKNTDKMSKLTNLNTMDRLGRVNKFLEDIEKQNNQETLNKIYKSIISEIVVDASKRDAVKVKVNFL